MSEEPPRRPPPPPRLQLISEDDVPVDTERLPAPPAPPKLPEPFRKLRETDKRPATIRELTERVYACEAAARETLATVRKVALEMDGLGTVVNTRFNIFHQELSMLRHEVVRVDQGVEERIDVAVEERLPLSQRAKRAAKWVGAEGARGTVAGTVLLLLLGLAARQWPWLGELLRGYAP